MVISKTYIATPPGYTIKEQLVDRGISQKEFAARMGMSEKHISKLINGEVQLTHDMSVRLETVLGIEASFWNKLEALYREKLAKAIAENSMDDDIKIAGKFPYDEMAALGWIPKEKNPNKKVINLRKFFEVTELKLLEDSQITRIACRRLAVTESSDAALMAWTQRARYMAREISTSLADIKKLNTYIPEIRSMTAQEPNEFLPRLKEILQECGIALILIPHLKNCFLHGATFLYGGKIVIGLTTREKYADRFWICLFHEIGHIILKHINNPLNLNDKDESAADEWAENILIPQEEYNQFINNGKFSKTEICLFAEKIGVQPGIVVGRLQSDQILKPNALNDLKQRYAIEV